MCKWEKYNVCNVVEYDNYGWEFVMVSVDICLGEYTDHNCFNVNIDFTEIFKWVSLTYTTN